MATEDETSTRPKRDDTILKEDTKLWIGNIDKHITEYQLVQVLKKFGKIKNFEFMFHKHGPLKGQPRGYCFVDFENKQDAEQALSSLQGKKVLTKCLLVDWAKQKILSDDNICGKGEKRLIKKTDDKKMSTKSKIKAIEAKLSLLEQNDDSSSKMTSYKWQMQSKRDSQHPYLHNRKSRHLTR